MPAPSKRRQIEAKEQRPIQAVLVDMYRKHGSQTQVARELGVSQGTVSGWLKELGYREWTTIIYQPRPEPRELELPY